MTDMRREILGAVELRELSVLLLQHVLPALGDDTALQGLATLLLLI
jgi:hypothetical protein